MQALFHFGIGQAKAKQDFEFISREWFLSL